MPLYEYRCKACGERFEKLVRMNDQRPLIYCPACTSEEVERALSMFATGGGQRTTSAADCGPVG